MNGAELFIHHEDVRRGAPGWEPRPADDARDDALWALVTRMGRLLYRRSPVGVVVRRPSGEQAVIRTGPGLVTVEGEPGEILLHGSRPRRRPGRAARRAGGRRGADGGSARVLRLRGQPPKSLPIWSEKVSTDSVPNSRIDQTSPASRHPRTRIGAGRILRLIRISRPE